MQKIGLHQIVISVDYLLDCISVSIQCLRNERKKYCLQTPLANTFVVIVTILNGFYEKTRSKVLQS